MLASMTGERCRVRRPSLDADTIILLEALRSMGLEAALRDGDLVTDATDMGMSAVRADVASSERAFCLVSALASDIPRRFTVDGALPPRFPMHTWVNALLSLSVTCEFPREDWKLPLNLRGPHGSRMTYLPGDSPPLMFLALILSSFNGVTPFRVEAVGPRPLRLLHPCDARLMSEFELRVEQSARALRNPGGQRCRAAEVRVPGDERLSEFLACLGLAHGRIRVGGLPMAPPLLRCLEAAGLDASYSEGTMEAASGRAPAGCLDARGCLEAAPLLLVAASSLPGGGRVHLGERGAAGREGEPARECLEMLRAMGCPATLDQGVALVPETALGPTSARLRGDEGDLTLVLAASLSPGMELDGLDLLESSYPGIASGLRALGLEIPPLTSSRIPLL